MLFKWGRFVDPPTPVLAALVVFSSLALSSRILCNRGSPAPIGPSSVREVSSTIGGERTQEGCWGDNNGEVCAWFPPFDLSSLSCFSFKSLKKKSLMWIVHDIRKSKFYTSGVAIEANQLLMERLNESFQFQEQCCLFCLLSLFPNAPDLGRATLP